MRPIPALALLVALLPAAACNEVPVEDLRKSFTITVKHAEGEAKGVAIDFLFVVDNSSSMCTEQVALAEGFAAFTRTLDEVLDVDARVAVTTMDAPCDPTAKDATTGGGTFVTRPIERFNGRCQEMKVTECQSNEDCVAAHGPGQWACHANDNEAVCSFSENDSVLTRCALACAGDADCVQHYGPGFECATVSGLTACVPQAPNADATCPTEVPPFLTNAELGQDLFRCQAAVGVNTSPCAKHEAGLGAALLALDPHGDNAAQSAAFLRPDAYLVILFLSDEDDCSTAPGQYISENDRNRCARTGTTEAGGPLVPVSEFINKFKALKADPSRVIVAAIVGDTLAEAEEVEGARAAYLAAMDSHMCHQEGSYICQNGGKSGGTAHWGRRYLELTEGFGLHGLTQNLCRDANLEPALKAIAKLIIRVVGSVCLPRPIHPDNRLVVTRIRGGAAEVLTEGVHYAIAESGGTDCEVDGQARPAIHFLEDDAHTTNDEIVVEYQATLL